MRVDGFNTLTTAADTTQVSKTATSGTHTEKKLPSFAGTTEDKTTLSSNGSTVQTLTQSALSTSSARTSKVEALKSAVANGQYKPDSAKTAEALTSSVL